MRMMISENCLNLITKYEGLFLEAYLDPVGIPTIGYGTIRYPDGRKVRLGDEITADEAEAFLKFECDKVAEEVSDEVKVKLNQNQFDALVSFCYNVGTGAFKNSTLLRELNKGNYNLAAAEFPKWNKATSGGKKIELKGLTNRRNSEKALFEKLGGDGEPIVSDPSPQETVDLVEAQLDAAGKHVAVAYSGAKVIEIVELENTIRDSWIALLQQYPKAREFRLAAAGKAIPAGDRLKFGGNGGPIPKVPSPPQFHGVILSRGSEGGDVKPLQERLKDLGYYHKEVDGDFGTGTDDAVRRFQADYFGQAAADGKVGQKTWDKLWGDAAPAPSPKMGSTNFLRLSKTDRKDRTGCVVLKLEYFKAGNSAGSIEACSGQPTKQNFRTGPKSQSGSMEPIPEGRWSLHKIEWAGGKDNYSGKVWNGGLGPAKIRLDYEEPGTTRRSAIEIHIDWNRSKSPGTAGCIGLLSVADFKTLAGWIESGAPDSLLVDWGLGTCPKPA